jgi:hypothetical protein
VLLEILRAILYLGGIFFTEKIARTLESPGKFRLRYIRMLQIFFGTLCAVNIGYLFSSQSLILFYIKEYLILFLLIGIVDYFLLNFRWRFLPLLFLIGISGVIEYYRIQMNLTLDTDIGAWLEFRINYFIMKCIREVLLWFYIASLHFAIKNAICPKNAGRKIGWAIFLLFGGISELIAILYVGLRFTLGIFFGLSLLITVLYYIYQLGINFLLIFGLIQYFAPPRKAL